MKTRVAVLGGGVGSIAAAFELTATPELRDRFDVTVHQLGWRIGGKGASGRNMAAGGRIEEHGLHVWFGFYENAFRLMRQAYQELDRPPGTPLATLDDAFKGCDRIVLYDRQGDGWHDFAFDAPRNFELPGVPTPTRLPTFWEISERACRWALDRWREIVDERPHLADAAVPAKFTPSWFEGIAREVALDVGRLELTGAEHLLQLADRLARHRVAHPHRPTPGHTSYRWLLVKLLVGFRDWLWTHVVADSHKEDPHLRLFFTIFDTISTTAAGIVRDGVLDHGFDVINDEEWSAWLARHGAKDVTIGATPAERAPVLRSVYDVAFGYVGGDIAKADVAAGTATNDLLRLVFTYRGALMYKMQAGMGDTVFTPFYEVLKRRGVRFNFFNAITHLGLSPDHRSVETISYVPQVELKGADYDPLVDVRGLDCWPSEPLWEQLQDGERLREKGVDFEAEVNPLGREPERLHRGEDFDEVVLGIPVGALPPICGELIDANERFAKMVSSAATVQTQAFQLWLNEPSDSLGWEHSQDSVAGCYVEPLDTYCDMTHLLSREDWEDGDGVHSVAYFCGVLDDIEGETAEAAQARAKANAIEFLQRDIGSIWPQGVEDHPRSPLRWDLLADPGGGTGHERFDAQFWRANTSLSERYVLTPAGSVKHRLASDDSGFDNVVLAGDWTRNGIDGGCVEAAATSGIQAARGLIGGDQPIIGEDPTWLRPSRRGLPRYVEFGGRATSPSPFSSTGGRMRSFVLDGDGDRIRELVRQTLTEPAGGAIEYRPLGDKVLLMIGAFDAISSTTPPYDRWGSIREVQASLWVPVLAGHDHGPVFVAERLCLAVPYILVDNPMSYLGGREDYGYAKTMGRFDPAEGVGERLTVEAYGGDFGSEHLAGWHPLLEVAPAGRRDKAGKAIEGAAALARMLADGVLDGHEGELRLPGLKLGEQMVTEMLAGRSMQVFLKQFRDAADGTLACYQAVVEAPVQVTRVSSRPSLRDWEVTVHPLDSHPIAEELGVTSQTASLAFEVEIDFIVEDGVEIGRRAEVPSPPQADNGAAAAPSGASPSPGGSLTEDVFDLAGAVLGRLRRELSALGRLKPW